MNTWAQACYGGNWDNGANAGLFYGNANNAPSNANSNIGARLAKDEGQMPSQPRLDGQCQSFGACVLSENTLEDKQPSAAQHRVAGGDLYARIIDYENLVAAYHEARKGKRYKPEALAFADRWEERLIELHEHLLWRSWRPGVPRIFTVHDPKKRDITAPPFADRIVHHALVRMVEPLFEKRFIYDSYACRVGKGSHAAVRRAQHFLRRAKRRWGDGIYVVHADVKSFFSSIRHDVAMDTIGRVVSDPDVLWLWRTVMSGYGYVDGVGVPVGALTSQLVGNIMLDAVDHRIKDDIGERYYLRYMDDMVVICRDKAHARKALDVIGDACAARALRLNPKSHYAPWQRGLDFCGYRIWPTHILPRKRTVKRWRKRLRVLAQRYAVGDAPLSDAQCAVASMLAYLKHASAAVTADSILKDFTLIRSAT